MKYNLELLKADIGEELRKIERLERAFARVEPSLGSLRRRWTDMTVGPSAITCTTSTTAVRTPSGVSVQTLPVIPAWTAGIQTPWRANREGGLNAYG
jgi:hypothetical protein